MKVANSLITGAVLGAFLSISSLAVAAEKHDHHNHKANADTNAKVFIVSPVNGDTVPTTFKVKFGATGVDIVPAGTNQPNSGHHHLLIDTDTLPNLQTPLPTTPTLLHFGKAQTETEVTLTPGKHTLQLVLGDYMHVPGEHPIVSEKITVTVK
jgi:hypothetical protein